MRGLAQTIAAGTLALGVACGDGEDGGVEGDSKVGYSEGIDVDLMRHDGEEIASSLTVVDDVMSQLRSQLENQRGPSQGWVECAFDSNEHEAYLVARDAARGEANDYYATIDREVTLFWDQDLRVKGHDGAIVCVKSGHKKITAIPEEYDPGVCTSMYAYELGDQVNTIQATRAIMIGNGCKPWIGGVCAVHRNFISHLEEKVRSRVSDCPVDVQAKVREELGL